MTCCVPVIELPEVGRQIPTIGEPNAAVGVDMIDGHDGARLKMKEIHVLS
jgi:hypothetical protein